MTQDQSVSHPFPPDLKSTYTVASIGRHSTGGTKNSMSQAFPIDTVGYHKFQLKETLIRFIAPGRKSEDKKTPKANVA